MLCQNCKKNQATFHYKSNDNGNVTEKHLCAYCASKEGYTTDGVFNTQYPFGIIDNYFADAQENIFGGILGNMLGTTSYTKSSTGSVCAKCGMRYSDFIEHGRLGCSECYDAFSAYLMPTVKQIHGNTKHNGKFPEGIQQKVQTENRLKTLKEKLQQAVANEDYESAVKFRDEIRQIESNNIKDDFEAGEI